MSDNSITSTISQLKSSNYEIHFTDSENELIAKKIHGDKMSVIQVFRHKDGYVFDVFGMVIPKDDYDLTSRLANNGSRMKFFRELYTTSTYLGAFPIYNPDEISMKISDIMRDADVVMGVK